MPKLILNSRSLLQLEVQVQPQGPTITCIMLSRQEKNTV